MITAIHGNHAQGLFFSFFGHDRSMTLCATWCEFIMKATDAVAGIVGVDCEWHAIQASTARRAYEATRMVRSATGFQNPVLDGSSAHCALVQGMLVVVLAQRLFVHSVERTSDQSFLADVAGKAIQMISLIEGGAPRSHQGQSFATFGAVICSLQSPIIAVINFGFYMSRRQA
jgi:hypothetical protein